MTSKKQQGTALLLVAVGIALYGLTAIPASGEGITMGIALILATAIAIGVGGLYVIGHVPTDTADAEAPAPPAPAPAPAPTPVEPPVLAPGDEGGYRDHAAASAPLGDDDRNHPDVKRIQQVLDDSKDPLKLDAQSLQFAADLNTGSRKLQAFTLISDPAFFTLAANKTRIRNTYTEAVRGNWIADFSPDRDEVTVTRMVEFKKIIVPPKPVVQVRTLQEAIEKYEQFAYPLGQSETGEPLLVKPVDIPHGSVIGGTGAGKSVFTRGIIEWFRAGGWMLCICDGKHTDYVGLLRENGVVAVSTTEPDHARLVHFYAEELNRRRNEGERKKRAGDPNWKAFPPALLLLDEFATMKNELQSYYENRGGMDQFDDDISVILKVGREFRMHVIIATQEMYNDTIRGDWLGNLKLAISLGRPHHKTVEKAFPKEYHSDINFLGGKIPDTERGRGIYVNKEPKEGERALLQFKSYYSYSPGEDVEGQKDPEVRANWLDFKNEVSDQVPHLYPRMWFQYDDEYTEKPLEELYDYPAIALQQHGSLDVPAELRKWDPNSDEYIGEKIEESGSGMVYFGA